MTNVMIRPETLVARPEQLPSGINAWGETPEQAAARLNAAADYASTSQAWADFGTIPDELVDKVSPSALTHQLEVLDDTLGGAVPTHSKPDSETVRHIDVSPVIAQMGGDAIALAEYRDRQAHKRSA